MSDAWDDLYGLCRRVRCHVLAMATHGGCFVGSAFSCVEILAYLYARQLRLTPESIGSEDRDYFFLSKGHAVPALYGVLAELGYLDPVRLEHHLDPEDDIYWHPNRGIPGVEFHSGSLGHGLPVALGVAWDLALRERGRRCYVLCGDGELNEGSMWEALLVAGRFPELPLTLVVDRNGFQANVSTESLNPLEPLVDKLTSFGWDAVRVDGHRFSELSRGFSGQTQRPRVVIADTVRGKGIPSIEARADRWFVSLRPEEAAALQQELERESPGPVALASAVQEVCCRV
ncbi:MAG: transketolase [Polyangiaceae bacterium]|nr:transketolase [Polyangiaceae bacterium]